MTPALLLIIILGGVTVLFFLEDFSQFFRNEKPRKYVPVQRGRPIMVDERFGTSEIIGCEMMGKDKFKLSFENGSTETYDEHEIEPINLLQVIAGKGRPYYRYVGGKLSGENKRFLVGEARKREEGFKQELRKRERRKEEEICRRIEDIKEVIGKSDQRKERDRD